MANVSDPIDCALTAILKASKKNVRDQLARSMARNLSGPPNSGAANLEKLKKQVKAKNEKIRRLEKSMVI